MGRYIKPSIIFLLLLCIAVACDGTGGNNTTTRTIGPEGGTITSSDGKLTLEIPAGALTEDTEITIKRLKPGEISEEFGEANVDGAYELTPEGLNFDMPVRASVKLDEDPNQTDGTLSAALAFLFLESGDVLEFLENTELEVDGPGSMTTVSADLTHFTDLATVTTDLVTETREGVTVTLDMTKKEDIPNKFTGTVTVTSTADLDDVEADIFDRDNTSGAIFDSPVDFPNLPFPLAGGTSTATIDGQCLQEKETKEYVVDMCIERVNIVALIMRTPDFFSDVDIKLKTEIVCKKTEKGDMDPTDTSPTDPPPPPPPLPEINIDEILAQFDLNCTSKQDTFQIFIGNFGGSPFSFLIIIDLNNENRGLLDARGLLTTDIIITTPDDLFTLEGQLTDLEDGTFGAEAEGSGFLGDMNPAAADIIVKAEDWIFDLDEEGNVILREGDLRFNFPGLLLSSQSSVAECTGIKVVE